MSVTIRQAFRNSFGTTVPVLTPLYSASCDSWQITGEGEFHCGNNDHCQLPLRLDGIEKKHCSLLFRSGTLRIRRDSGRIWVNDLPVAGECDLAPGDILNIGPVCFEVGQISGNRSMAGAIGPAMQPPQVPQLPPPDSPALERAAEQRPALANLQQAAVEMEQNAIEILEQTLQRRCDEADRRLKKLREMEIRLTSEMEGSAATCAELDQRAAAIRQRECEIEDRASGTRRLQQEIEEQRADLLRQKESLNAQSLLLIQRTEELDARAAELAEQQQTRDAAEFLTAQETHSVQQMAALAAEREAILRARQEADQANAQAKASKAALDLQEARLLEWEAEVDSRHAELARRVIQFKSKRTGLKAERGESGSPQAAEPGAEWKKLSEQQAEVAAAEARLHERLEATRLIVETCETEREALQNSFKDLTCERNALVQKSQDLQSREASLQERERTVDRQMETLRSRFEALTEKSAALQKEEAELNSRAADVHRMIAQFRSEIRNHESERLRSEADADGAGTQNSETPAAAAEFDALTEALRESSDQLDAMTAERDALFTAVRELQDALQNARSDVEEASRLRTESARQTQILSELQQSVADRSSQLQRTESQLQLALEQVEELKAQAAQLTQDRDELARCRVASDAAVPAGSGDDTEMQLLSQLESLRSELNQSAAGDAARESQFRNTIAERDQCIENLEREVESLRTQLAAPELKSGIADDGEKSDLTELQARLEQTKKELKDREELVRELQSRLQGQLKQTPVDAKRLEEEARELDRRANLLDKREEELRERARRIDQSEGDIESQRRQLLESRQQLEVARAEIQIAMKQHSPAIASPVSAQPAAKPLTVGSGTASPKEGVTSDRSPGAECTKATDPPETDGEDESQDVKKIDLAGLFGIKKPAAGSIPAPAEQESIFVDLSEAAGQSKTVAFRFKDDASAMINNAPSAPAAKDSPAADAGEQSDDFVRDYMEQLLSRSRQSAGNALPNELKPAESRNKSASQSPKKAESQPFEAAASPKQPPIARSFIEQYMAGGFGDLTGDGSITVQPESLSELETTSAHAKMPEPMQPRVKIDLEKMRASMDSFRTVSTQSVSNALVNHAMRRERQKFTGRIMLAVALVGMCLFLAAANALEIIDYPLLTWVCLIAAIGAGTEFFRKQYHLKARCRDILLPEDAGPERDNDVPAGKSAKAQGRRAGVLASPVSGIPPVTANPEQLHPADCSQSSTEPAVGGR